MQRSDSIPPQGAPDTLVERLRAYVGPHAPALVSRFAGATEAQVAAYARAAGFGDVETVPASYRAFLRGMGRDDGGLFRIVNLDTEVDGLLELYEDWHRTQPGSVNPDLPVAAMYLIGDQISFDLPASGRGEPPLVDTADGHRGAARGRSWEALVMQAAMLYVESRRLPRVASFGAVAAGQDQVDASSYVNDLMARVRALAARFDLTPAWPSDDQHCIAVGPRHTLYAEVVTDQSVALGVFGSDEEFVRAVQTDLVPVLGLTGPKYLQLVDGVLRAAPARVAA